MGANQFEMLSEKYGSDLGAYFAFYTAKDCLDQQATTAKQYAKNKIKTIKAETLASYDQKELQFTNKFMGGIHWQQEAKTKQAVSELNSDKQQIRQEVRKQFRLMRKKVVQELVNQQFMILKDIDLNRAYIQQELQKDKPQTQIPHYKKLSETQRKKVKQMVAIKYNSQIQKAKNLVNAKVKSQLDFKNYEHLLSFSNFAPQIAQITDRLQMKLQITQKIMRNTKSHINKQILEKAQLQVQMRGRASSLFNPTERASMKLQQKQKQQLQKSQSLQPYHPLFENSSNCFCLLFQ